MVTTPSGVVELPAMTSSQGATSERRPLVWLMRMTVAVFSGTAFWRRRPAVGSAFAVSSLKK
jgi:hypothetical protein